MRGTFFFFAGLLSTVLSFADLGDEAVRPPDLSLRNEVARAIDRGCGYLLERQAPDGSWSDADHPALTALVLLALQSDPQERHADRKAEALRRGYEYLIASAQPDGGIYRIDSLKNYNTAVSLLALVAGSEPANVEPARRARRYLIAEQQDFGAAGESDTPLDGGIGYGSRYQHSDLSNTSLALEALHRSRHLVEEAGADKLDWDAAIRFVQNCQNLPESNKQVWVSGDPANRGGFVYYPGDSKAGEMVLPSGRVALRSYGSMSYAGLLSYVCAELKPADHRVVAVRRWLESNYTLDENPGMGAQGLYYYYHTMAKALSLAGVERLEVAEGKSVRWAPELALRLMDLQRTEGHWANDNARWWEKDPILSSSYTVLALAYLYPWL